MQIRYLESVDSTQIYLKELLRSKKVKPPYAVVANSQTDGIGSRDNSWIEMDGNLYLSFTLELKELPSDLKLESASIYFAFLLQDVLNNLNSSVWLKWPNDFYIDDLKLGGMITNIVGNSLVCGVGLNLVNAPQGFTTLDIEIKREELLEKYFTNIEKNFSWKQVFSKYKLEFCRNQNFFTHKNSLRISLGEAELQSDGSILINDERIYSLR
ncbi:MAG: biotin--[acetyl-CoA-carboxylase] ligase [Campylobacterota bacterium]